MHAAALHVIRTANRPASRYAYRIIAGVRYPHHLSNRSFHQSPARHRSPEDPNLPTNEGESTQPRSAIEGANGGAAELESLGSDGPGSIADEDTSVPLQRTRAARIGSGRVKANRPRQPEGLPPIQLPEWFLKDSVRCAENNSILGNNLAVYSTREAEVDDEGVKPSDIQTETDIANCDLAPINRAKYSIHVHVYQEILSAIRANLALRPPKLAESQPLNRPVTHLYCPKDGGSYYLDSVVETIASKLGADLITLDAQDIAQILSSYVDENVAWTQSSTAVLGYETQRAAGKLEDFDKNEDGEQEEAEEEEEDFMGYLKNNKSKPKPYSNLSNIAKKLTSYKSFVMPKNDFGQSRSTESLSNFPFLGITGIRVDPPAANSDSDQWKSLKTTAILNALISAAETKRGTSSPLSDSLESVDLKTDSRGTIIQVRDYKTISQTPSGADILGQLRTAINKRWKEGKNIILVGTTSMEEEESALSKPEIQRLQSQLGERTIYVPPDRREEQEVTFESDEKVRVRRINIRHIEDMIGKLSESTHHLSPIVQIERDLDSVAIYSSGLEDAVWTYSRVFRVSSTVLGLEDSLPVVDGPALSKALELLASSDEAKFSWGAAELKEEEANAATIATDSAEAVRKNETTKDRIKQLRKTCNPHEKKLLSGVVIPSEIRTTFNDIRAPNETVEALKTLTSLSLKRPEAFSYGVLATDRLPGLLLYGPPGTGKTLLAKAVAKESGATMLEISGADINDMFVGEGEKNVKAVFSLAKKLSPCVVFIDECDSVFSSRSEPRRSGAHREMINQFLREWDGMNDLSAFIMVATNRPFDLDEAVLRRLPRRLLLDLPVEKEREAILKIHLKDEVLDESVSLSKLAKATPFYSGSDLKNLSVAAALACVREENEAAAKHSSPVPHQYPEKRLLTKSHFDKALEEISASISEDMSTLSAIRKFDEKYGDRKGRRKKTSALGFGGTTVVEQDSEAARVRKMEV